MRIEWVSWHSPDGPTNLVEVSINSPKELEELLAFVNSKDLGAIAPSSPLAPVPSLSPMIDEGGPDPIGPLAVAERPAPKSSTIPPTRVEIAKEVKALGFVPYTQPTSKSEGFRLELVGGRTLSLFFSKVGPVLYLSKAQGRGYAWASPVTSMKELWHLLGRARKDVSGNAVEEETAAASRYSDIELDETVPSSPPVPESLAPSEPTIKLSVPPSQKEAGRWTVDQVRRAIIFHFQGKYPAQTGNEIGVPALLVAAWIERAYKALNVDKPNPSDSSFKQGIQRETARRIFEEMSEYDRAVFFDRSILRGA